MTTQFPIAEDTQEIWDTLRQRANELCRVSEQSDMTTTEEHMGFDAHGYYVWVWPRPIPGTGKKELVMIRVIHHNGTYWYCVADGQFRSAQTALCRAHAIAVS